VTFADIDRYNPGTGWVFAANAEIPSLIVPSILEFSSMYEAEDAVRKLEGVDINGVQVKLEIVGVSVYSAQNDVPAHDEQEGGGGRDSHDRRPPPPRDYGYDRPRYEDRGGYGRDRSPPRRDYGRYDDRRDDRRDYGRERDRSPPRRSYDDRGDRGDRGGRDEDRYSRDDRPPRDDRPARDERDRNGSVRD
jgi:arginine/serine-rich splicing factor 4/5/6